MQQEDIGYLLNRTARQLRLRLAGRLAEFGLRPQQGAVLMALSRSALGRLTPSQIAESIDTDPPTTSGVIERLERDGWVASEPNPDDGRSRLIALTEKAQAVVPSVFASAEEVSRDATSCLTPEEVRLLAQLLERLVDDAAGHALNQEGAR